MWGKVLGNEADLYFHGEMNSLSIIYLYKIKSLRCQRNSMSKSVQISIPLSGYWRLTLNLSCSDIISDCHHLVLLVNPESHINRSRVDREKPRIGTYGLNGGISCLWSVEVSGAKCDIDRAVPTCQQGETFLWHEAASLTKVS